MAEIQRHDLIDPATLDILGHEQRELVAASIETAAGNATKDARILRALGTPTATELLVSTYLDEGEIDEAVDTLRAAAASFHRVEYTVWTASILYQNGKLEEAEREALIALDQVPSEGSLRTELRHTLLEIANRREDWVASAAHARAALDEDTPESERVAWALIGGLYIQRELKSAVASFDQYRPDPIDEPEARLAIQLLTTGDRSEGSIRRILDVTDQFSDSETVVAQAFGALLKKRCQSRACRCHHRWAAAAVRLTSGDLISTCGRRYLNKCWEVGLAKVEPNASSSYMLLKQGCRLGVNRHNH